MYLKTSTMSSTRTSILIYPRNFLATKTVICRDVHGGECEVLVEKLSWRPSAYGVVVREGKMLVSKQFGDKYDLPGGGIELGETPEQAVIREVKEETGLDVANPQFVAVASNFFVWPTAEAPTEFYASILMYYTCDFIGGELSTDGFDEYEKEYAELAEWYELSKLGDLKVASSHDWRPVVRKITAE
jgi:8-oxo-dGTP pyrophosphatase MutT (NUDIX family)